MPIKEINQAKRQSVSQAIIDVLQNTRGLSQKLMTTWWLLDDCQITPEVYCSCYLTPTQNYSKFQNQTGICLKTHAKTQFIIYFLVCLYFWRLFFCVLLCIIKRPIRNTGSTNNIKSANNPCKSKHAKQNETNDYISSHKRGVINELE